MLPLARFKSQPVGMVTTTPWLSLSTEPAPQWTWLASWSAATYQATPPPLTYHPAVWIPEHSHLVQWDRPAVEVIPVLPVFYRSSPLHPYHPLPKLPEGWIPIDEVGVFTRRDKPLPQANQMAQRPVGHAPRLLSLSRLFGPVLRDVPKTRDVEAEDSCPSVLPVRLLSASPLRLPLLTAPPAGGACRQWAGLPAQGLEEVWPLIQPYQGQKGAWLQPTISNDKRLTPPTQCVFGPVCPLQLTKDKCPGLPVQLMNKVRPSFFSSQFSSRFTLLTDYRHKKQLVGGAKVSYGGALLLRAESHKQGADVLMHTEEKEGGDGGENKRPVASTPVPGSPWCVVWTGDDRMFFFNPTMHLSVWERPGELIGRDISRIIEDPPHKRKKMTSADRSSSCQSLSSHGDDEDEDEDDGQKHKRNRTDESLSLVPRPREVKLLPLELRMEHFRQMLLERGVSAFSSWEKELHKMVFDPRYLLLTSDQRKQVFEQFVKSRVKEEYKEKRSKLQKAREDFKQLLEESKVTSRSTFREFCARYHGDQRFSALTRKKDQEVLFSQHVCSLKRRDRENRAWLRRTR